jgi:hypothetical protein
MENLLILREDQSLVTDRARPHELKNFGLHKGIQRARLNRKLGKALVCHLHREFLPNTRDGRASTPCSFVFN